MAPSFSGNPSRNGCYSTRRRSPGAPAPDREPPTLPPPVGKVSSPVLSGGGTARCGPRPVPEKKCSNSCARTSSTSSGSSGRSSPSSSSSSSWTGAWGTRAARGTDTTLAAKAGGIRVTTAEFQKEYAFAEERYRQAYGKNFSPELARAMNLPEQVLNGMIDRRLLRGEAEKLGIKVTDEELTQHLLGIKDPQSGRPLFVKDGVFVGDAAYKRILAANRLSPESFEADSRDALVLEKLNRFYTQSMVVGDDDVKAEYEGREREGEDRVRARAPGRRGARRPCRTRRPRRGSRRTRRPTCSPRSARRSTCSSRRRRSGPRSR